MEITLRLILLLLRVLYWLTYPIYWLVALRPTSRVPPIKNPLLLISATALAEKIRQREIKSEVVVLAYIERIKEVNPILNAVVEDRFEDALKEARDVDKLLSMDTVDVVQLQGAKPLLGVPVTIKDSCGVEGMRQTAGSFRRRNVRAVTDGVAVAKIRRAGGIILSVSNTPEFCLYWESNNRVTGCTNNPYNTHYSASGSSGGEGALLGAAASIIGIGSDVAGSLRLPALCNGIFAHKCTARLVDTEGHFPPVISDSGKFHLVLGPMVRYAEDLPLVMKILVDPSEGLQFAGKVDLGELNVFYMLETNSCISNIPVDSETKLAINKCVAHLQHACGSNVDEFKFSLSNAIEISAAVFFNMDDLPNILENPKSANQSDSVLLELLKQAFGRSNYSWNGLVFTILQATRGFILPSRRKVYEEELENLKLEFESRLGENGVLLCPSFPTNAYQHNQYIYYYSGLQYQSIFNNLGLPCTHVTLGIGRNGMPIGIQVVAGPRQDKLCFAVAKELETAFGGWQPPTKHPKTGNIPY